MSAIIIQFPTSPLYDARIEFARRVERRMAEVEDHEREIERVYAGERPCDCEEKD